MIARRTAVYLLALVGGLQMIGDLTGSLPLRAIGAATGAAPAPRPVRRSGVGIRSPRA